MNILEGLQVTVIGMGVVVLVLFALVLLLKLFESFLYKGKDSGGNKPSKPKRVVKVQENDELDEVVAVVSAVMADILDNNECVVNIRQLN